MIIEKTASYRSKCYSKMFFIESARKGERIILDYFVKAGGYQLLLPAYIGFSVKEGSGIYDPVIESKIAFDFYRINRNITVNLNDLKKKLVEVESKGLRPIVLLVHYFGYPDNAIKQVVDACREYDAIMIEDCAHALFTDYIDQKCGKYGDLVLYSIHKMLPYNEGGILKINNTKYNFDTVCKEHDKSFEYGDVFRYDFHEISYIRKQNALAWEKLINEGNCTRLKVFKSNTCEVTPQTYPVFIHDYDRTKLYFKLNDAGFGAVSLYHTMIRPIEEKYEDSVWISHHIMNLPVHQDVTEDQICRMYEVMCNILMK